MKVDEAIKRALRAGEEEDRELKLAAYILATEYTQLRGKLPKTADDVPVVPGMMVYWLYPTARSGGTEFCVASGNVRYVKTVSPTDYYSEFTDPIVVATDNGDPLLRACYSTREAAEGESQKAIERAEREAAEAAKGE